jgi:hypothetical protein
MARGTTGDPPALTAAVAWGDGVGRDGVLVPDGAALGVPSRVGAGVDCAVIRGDGGASTPAFAVAIAGFIEGLGVGVGVGRGVTRGVGRGVGDGGGVGARLTVMLPCIAAKPWMLQ